MELLRLDPKNRLNTFSYNTMVSSWYVHHERERKFCESSVRTLISSPLPSAISSHHQSTTIRNFPEDSPAKTHLDVRHVYTQFLYMLEYGVKMCCRSFIVSTEGRNPREFSVIYFYQPRRGHATTRQEGGVLESSRLFSSDVKITVYISYVCPSTTSQKFRVTYVHLQRCRWGGRTHAVFCFLVSLRARAMTLETFGKCPFLCSYF